MTSQTLLFRVALVVIILLVGYITIPGLLRNEDEVIDSVPTAVDGEKEENDDMREVEDKGDDQREDNEDDSSGGDSSGNVEENAPIEVTKDVVVSPPSSVPEPALYTVSTVAMHNTEMSCWSIISGNVYDLTSFIGDHPGGERNILKICGKDGTSAFMGQHGGDSKPEKTLAGFLLGPLTE